MQVTDNLAELMGTDSSINLIETIKPIEAQEDKEYQIFDHTTHVRLAQLYSDSNSNSAVCMESFLNEGYNPTDISNCICRIINDTAKVSQTLPSPGTDGYPKDTRCPQPCFDGGMFATAEGARVLFELRDPHVVLFDDFLSDEECEHLCSLAQERFKRSLVVSDEGDQETDSRSSKTAHTILGETEIIKNIELRISRVVNWPILKAESIQIIKYDPGQEYKPHYDFFSHSPTQPHLAAPGNQRTATLIMYLEEPLRGGATFFPNLGLRVPARKGQALFFSYPTPGDNHNTFHSGEPVIEGNKTIATKWFKTLLHGV